MFNANLNCVIFGVNESLNKRCILSTDNSDFMYLPLEQKLNTRIYQLEMSRRHLSELNSVKNNLAAIAQVFFDQSDNFSKTNYFILDSGNSEAGISTAVNNNPLEHYAKAAMRYNLFLTQILDITVPCNPNLKAGDTIQCEFEKVTVSNKNEGAVDEQQSGKYIILHLCHYFTPKRSFTSLRLTRDTYGLYTSGGL